MLPRPKRFALVSIRFPDIEETLGTGLQTPSRLSSATLHQATCSIYLWFADDLFIK